MTQDGQLVVLLTRCTSDLLLDGSLQWRGSPLPTAHRCLLPCESRHLLHEPCALCFSLRTQAAQVCKLPAADVPLLALPSAQTTSLMLLLGLHATGCSLSHHVDLHNIAMQHCQWLSEPSVLPSIS
jgi:hypothetical protein